MSNRKPDIESLRGEVVNAEQAIIDLNRRLTAAIIAKQPAGVLSSELHEMIGARDFMVERLKRLRGAAI